MAGFTVDLGTTTDYRASIGSAVGVDDTPASGEIVGQIVDLQHAHGFTNVFVGGGPTSGPLTVLVQTSPTTNSGDFTDPTSGRPLKGFNSFILSGGAFYVNSGLHVSGNYSLSSPVDDAPLFCSGGMQIGGFLRPHRYVRLRVLSGSAFDANVVAGFIEQKRYPGSGGGQTQSPGSGGLTV